MEMLATYMTESLYVRLYYLFTILSSLHGFSMASLKEEFISNLFNLGFARVTDCD